VALPFADKIFPQVTICSGFEQRIQYIAYRSTALVFPAGKLKNISSFYCEPKPASKPMRHLKDRAAKALCVPMLGIAIPNLTGLIHNGRYSMAGIFASYLYFIFIALVVW